MTFVLRCKDTGADCNWVVRADSEEEVLRQAAQHAKDVHGMQPGPELEQAARSLMRRE